MLNKQISVPRNNLKMDLATAFLSLAKESEKYNAYGILSTLARNFDLRANVRTFLLSATHSSCTRATLHANGFLKMEIARAQIGPALRIHVWLPTDRQDETTHEVSDIHDHRWNFASLVIVGKYRQDTYIANSSGEAYFSYRYSDEPGISEFTKLPEKKHLSHVQSENIGPTAINSLSHDGLHRVSTSNRELTVTLFVTSAPLKEFTMVYSESEIDKGDSVFGKPSGEGEILHALSTVLTVL